MAESKDINWLYVLAKICVLLWILGFAIGLMITYPLPSIAILLFLILVVLLFK